MVRLHASTAGSKGLIPGQGTKGASLITQLVKNPPANAGDVSSIPGSGRSPGEKNGNPRQYACLENPTDRGTWQATVLRVRKSGT